MTNIVEYILSLQNENFNTGIASAEAGVVGLEGALGSVGKMLGTLGVGFAIFKGAEFVHDGVEAMHELEQSVAQVKAGLVSTKGAAGLTFDDVEKSAKGLAAALPYSRKEILDMQAQILTFPAITKSTFGEASQAILDMSSRTHRGANELAIMLGKALQDPAHGITAMRRVGVNFNDIQTEMVKKMAATGHMAEAQKVILQELSLEFAGSARAAADADPLFRYNKLMGSIKMAAGEAAMSLLHELTPALESFAGSLKSVIDWIREHKEGLEALGKALIAVGTFMVTAKVATAAYTMALTFAAPVLRTFVFALASGTTAMEAGAVAAGEFGVALNVALGPVGWIALAITGLTVAMSLLNDEQEKHIALQAEETESSNKALQNSYTNRFAEMQKKSGMSMSEYIKSENKLIDKYLNEQSKLSDNALRNGGAVDGRKTQDLLLKKAALNALGNKSGTGSKAIPAAVGGGVKPSASSKAVGSKNVTINVHINDLVKNLTISTTNMKEGAARIKTLIEDHLTGAVNDFQQVAGQ